MEMGIRWKATVFRGCATVDKRMRFGGIAKSNSVIEVIYIPNKQTGRLEFLR